MSLAFQTEDWDTFSRDAGHIFPVHFAELALNQEKIPMGLDHDIYHVVEQNKLLHILTARLDGKIIGYILSLVVTRHPHNKEAGPYSTTDMFYVLKEHRNGTGVKLLIENERLLKELGVRRMAISTKLHSSQKELLEALGWKATDMVFHKIT